MNITSTRAAHLAVAVVATASLVAVASPAQARGGDDIVRRGDCAASTDWKLKVGADDGRLEVEGEIDSNRAGQSWNWLIRHNGTVAARGSRTTLAPSGSFEVRRLVTNLAGPDTIVFRATNPSTLEVCRGTLTF
jgi:hypothetical protein